MNALLPEEIIIGIIGTGGFKEFTADTSALHRDVFRLKQLDDYKEILKPFRFAGSPAAPFSRVLDMALFNLQFRNLLRKYNPDLIVYNVPEDTKSYYKKHVKPKLDDSNLTELFKTMAASFMERQNVH